MEQHLLYRSIFSFVLFNIFWFVNGKHPILVPNNPACTDSRLLKLDRYVSKIMTFGPYGRKFPNNMEQVGPYCDETRNLTSYLDKTVQECFPIELGNMAKLFIFSLKRMTRMMCSKRKKNKRLQIMLTNTECINSNIQQDNCLQSLVNRTKTLVPLNIGRDKINYICCDYVKYLRCEEGHMNNLPCSKPRPVEEVINLIRSVAEDTNNLACGEFTEQTDRCDSLIEPDFKKIDKNVPPPDKRFHSYMVATMEIFNSISEFNGQFP